MKKHVYSINVIIAKEYVPIIDNILTICLLIVGYLQTSIGHQGFLHFSKKRTAPNVSGFRLILLFHRTRKQFEWRQKVVALLLFTEWVIQF